jgi:hypothetical protein
MYRPGNRRARCRLLRVTGIGLSVLALAGAVGIGGLATAAEASTVAVSQYGPPPPPPPSVPGFTAVITSVTIGPAGGTIGPVSCDGASFVLTVPAGAFPTDVQITLTCGDLAILAPAAFTGFTVVTALGVLVQLHGATYPGTFLKPLTLVATDPALNASSVVGLWNGTSFINDPNVTAAAGMVTVTFDSDPNFGFMSPTTTPPKPVPHPTTPVTGKPLMGEGILAGLLLAAGIGGLGVTRRRRAAAARAASGENSN